MMISFKIKRNCIICIAEIYDDVNIWYCKKWILQQVLEQYKVKDKSVSWVR